MRELPDPEQAKPCVLVVDDDEAVAWAIAARLGSDFRVVSVSDPAQAVQATLEEAPGVILCDIDMPGMRGDEVAFALSQDPRTGAVPLIYLTGLVTPEEAPDLEGVFGEHPAISKGATPQDLRDAIEGALGLPED
ncbi:MAG TPA: response regulator [Ramlibacter sp.]|nr:response regulator [Ramlibacter sp.]